MLISHVPKKIKRHTCTANFPNLLNPIALRKIKPATSFGCSECNWAKLRRISSSETVLMTSYSCVIETGEFEGKEYHIYWGSNIGSIRLVRFMKSLKFAWERDRFL